MVKADAGVIVEGGASPGIDTGAAADAGTVTGGVPDRGVDVGASADAHGSTTKKRRRTQSRPMARGVQRYCQRMAEFGVARGDTQGSDPGPVQGHPAED